MCGLKWDTFLNNMIKQFKFNLPRIKLGMPDFLGQEEMFILNKIDTLFVYHIMIYFGEALDYIMVYYFEF